MTVSNIRIQSGDTLSGLAKRYNTTVDALAKANSLKDPNKIQAGRTLKVQDGFDAKGTKSSHGTKTSGDSFTPSTHGAQKTAQATSTSSTSTPSGELGGLSRKYEARGPGTVSTGKGDKGGVYTPPLSPLPVDTVPGPRASYLRLSPPSSPLGVLVEDVLVACAVFCAPCVDGVKLSPEVFVPWLDFVPFASKPSCTFSVRPAWILFGSLRLFAFASASTVVL